MSIWKQIITTLLLALAGLLLTVPSFGDSQVRIVRLSEVDGSVQIDRNATQGYEKAFLNSPIIEGAKLRTDANSRAEVEFEDGTTLRITPGTVVEFPVLSLRDSGAKGSTVKVEQGTAYLDFAGTKSDEFVLAFGREKIALTKPAHLRVEMKDTSATLAVFKGEVQVEGPSGTVEAGKKQSVNFDFENQGHSTLAKNVEADPFDSWDNQQAQYHQQYNNGSYNSYSPYAYGVSDLNYYGNFFNVAGYGMMWQPYFVGAGWDPFMDGAYLWYPGFGYTWVSAYPWGWTPYRYGSWRFLPGYGWAWQPGSAVMGWRPIPTVVNPPTRFTQPKPPTAPGQTVVVGRGPVVTPAGTTLHEIAIRSDSAGLGIPRGKVSGLGRLSQQVKADGFVSAPIRAALVRPTASISHGMGSSAHPSSSHMSAPASHSTSGAHSGSHK